MTRTELQKKLQEAIDAIQSYKREGLDRSNFNFEREEILQVERLSARLMTEAKNIGAAGSTCPACNGSGRL